MKVFLTGATGYVGSALVTELINAGHQVLGLTRSEAGAGRLTQAGARSLRGSLDDLSSLREGVAQSDGVIHCAYNNNLSEMEKTSKQESLAIETLGSGLLGSDRPLIITSVAAMGAAAPGEIATEDYYNPATPNPRKATEIAAEAEAKRGVNVSVVRLSQVHDAARMGFGSHLYELAREKGTSAYVGDGSNRWAAVPLSDTARLYRLALEKQQSGSRYHAVAEEGVPVRQIAEVIGAGLKLPVASLSSEEAATHFGWLAIFVGMDMAASSLETRRQLKWKPTGPTLLYDLEGSLHRGPLQAEAE